jgi:hypothetical protein
VEPAYADEMVGPRVSVPVWALIALSVVAGAAAATTIAVLVVRSGSSTSRIAAIETTSAVPPRNQ